MKILSLAAAVSTSLLLTLSACGGGGSVGSSSGPTVAPAPPNSVPVAKAGPAQAVTVGSSVTLSGLGSSDADKDALTYAWTLTTKPPGSSASIQSAGASQPTFTPDMVGDYVATLVVSDGKSTSPVSTTTISAKALGFSSLPPASPPTEGALPDWLIFKNTSALNGVTTVTLNASSLEGDFIINCTSDNKFSYYFRTTSITANGNVSYRIGPSIVSESWTESSSNGFKVLFPPAYSLAFLQKFYKDWDFVFQYNAYGGGVRTSENGSSGFSSAIDQTRADCHWPTDTFPPLNGWGKALPTVPPDDAKEATNVSGLDASKSVRLIAWKALNSAGKPQVLVRMGDAANTNNTFGLSDQRLYVTQDGKTVSAVSGYSFNNTASKPLIFSLNGDFDASRPLTLTLVAFHFHITDTLVPWAVVKLD